jgi:hypothetical protein
MTNQEIANHIKSFIGERVYYDEWGGGYIWGVKKNGVEMIAQVEDVEEGNSLVSVRGWGAIQNLKNLPCTPEEFQDHLGNFISDAINEKLERESGETKKS